MPARTKAKPKARAKARPKAKPKARAKKSTARTKKATTTGVRPSAAGKLAMARGAIPGGVVHRAVQRLKADKRTLAVRPFNRLVPPGGKATTVPGLLKPLRKVFFPKVTLPGNKGKKWRPMSFVKPTARGIRVHREVELWANRQWPTNKRVHKYTRAIIDTLNIKGLRPVAPEAALVSAYGYLTYSDQLCRRVRFDGKEELWVVSLKTGYSRNITRHSTQCHGAAGILTNSEQNFHLMQVACEIFCLRHEYNIEVAGGLIIYAGFGAGEQTVTVDLPAWALNQRFMLGVHQDLREKTDADTLKVLDTVVSSAGDPEE